jgi:hypothetical protein
MIPLFRKIGSWSPRVSRAGDNGLEKDKLLNKLLFLINALSSGLKKYGLV